MGMHSLPSQEQLLPGRTAKMPVAAQHVLLNSPMEAPFPEGAQQIFFGMGCFWGAERLFWNLKGIITTAAGYAGGNTPNPSYEEVCSGRTGHTEVVMVVYNPAELNLSELLTLFWESHDPTQGMRQGNDMGTQYRSAIYTLTDSQLSEVQASCKQYESALKSGGFGAITTEIGQLQEFYYAEDYHQQYLFKVPNGYCGLAGTGVCVASAP
ncbi:MAG: peptide-methionine (S)-S-oxide reductase MsrA [Pseudomonadales bacterium]|nr:peptide-methionine (S)-S-oxide reductase MsrA [Pseudomonadales bacterium]